MERLFNLAVSRTAPASDRERRSRSLLRGTASALVARAVGSLTGVITVPLTVRYLGAERYGAWMTISSGLLLLNFTDFGLASSLTNAVSKAFGENNREAARRYVSTTIFVFCFAALLIAVVGIAFAKPIAALMFRSLSEALLDREIVPTVIIALTIFALNFPLLITNRVLAAYQENATANLWLMAAGVASMIGVIIAIVLRAGLPALVLSSSGAGLIVTAASSVWLYYWHKPWLAPKRPFAERQFVRELFSTSWKFFIGNVAWLINSQTDNLIIAHYLGPALVTPYAVTFRLFAYATLIQGFAAQSIWPAYTEAVTRNDFDWVQGIFKKNLKWGLLIAISVIAILTVFGRTIIRIWAGSVAVPPLPLMFWMGAWNIILAYMFVAGTLLQATNRMTGLAIYSSITAVLNIGLSIIFVRPFGISGVIAATVIAYIIATIGPLTFETHHVLAGLRNRSVQ